MWMWSPRAGAMDPRFHHDGMGQDTCPEQLDALEITYEDYEPGFGTPYGVARTTDRGRPEHERRRAVRPGRLPVSRARGRAQLSRFRGYGGGRFPSPAASGGRLWLGRVTS
ncbi:hypothetical protein LCN96_15005 [Nonomuraea gerenzanensis]|uniref:PcRGLX/YetA-like central beta-sandwich domain-containing protein n=2 Tax=Nonomuraea gerenzanensis TaxID=93944 RepID=A0A1M4E5L9_9ACTN|nr:hypothetical protein LCN96_15005 [Nonomuraea gerenzanensis]SBO94083.1 FIG01125695: hypothetical protein [Nonomuraea gerenzanensis]